MNWIERDLKVSWHPYTQMKECQEVPPLLIDRAEGICLYDVEGRKYHDTISSWWCNIHGHNHPRIRKAMTEQLERLDHVIFAGFTHTPAITLAERLVGLTPEPLTRVFYTDNGSTAVESALKMSLQYWRNIGKAEKHKIVSLDLAYHGDTVGAMSVAGSSVFNEAFQPMLFESWQVPTPYYYRAPHDADAATCDASCLQSLRELLEQKHEQIAALIMEPLLLAAAGMVIYSSNYLQEAAALAKQYNVHLILDEVATGFGRTGTLFAFEQADIIPDFLCLSKGLTSGTLPIAVTMTREDIYDAFYDDYDKYKTFYHGHTYTGNPIGCAAALACLDIFEDEQVLEKAQPQMQRLQAEAQRFNELDCVGDVRGIGMVAAFELVKDKSTKALPDNLRQVVVDIFQRGLQKELILRPMGNVSYLYLPLATSDDELTLILDRTYEILAQVKL